MPGARGGAFVRTSRPEDPPLGSSVTTDPSSPWRTHPRGLVEWRKKVEERRAASPTKETQAPRRLGADQQSIPDREVGERGQERSRGRVQRRAVRTLSETGSG